MPTKKPTKTVKKPVSIPAKTVKKPVVITAKNQKTIASTPKEVRVDTSKLSKNKKFQELLDDAIAGIEIDTDDLDDDMLEAWEEFDDELRPKLAKKNWVLWATIFSPVILPGIVKGMRSEPTVPQPKVIIKGRQQEVVPPVEPRKIVDYCSEYFKNHGLELCKSLTETDLSRLKDDLKQNWDKGPDAFAEAFKKSYPVSKSRLEMIYKNERHQAEYSGVLERAKNADHSYKRWETIGDERTCDICLAMDGEIVPINEKFSNGQMIPSAHVNCRCSMTSYSEEDYDDLPDEYIRQDAAYLHDVADFIKLNYKCEFNGTDNKCGLDLKFGDKVPEKLQSVLNKSEEQKMALSNREQTAINNYKHFNYQEINGYLRDPTRYLSEDSKEDIQNMDNAFNKISMPDDMVVYSGLRRIPKDVDLKTIGNVFTVPEYTSSSILPQSSYRFAQSSYMLEIEIPKGSKALYVGSALRTNEKEVLINHGSTYEVIGLPEVKTVHNEFGDNNIKVVKVRLVNDNKKKQDAAYLSDVADQMKLNNAKDLLNEAANFIKLNFNCPKSYKDGEGEGSCKGYKPGSRQDDKPNKLSKKLETISEKLTVPNVTPETKKLVVDTKTIIAKVKKEKASGEVSKETKQELEEAVNKLRETNEVNEKEETFKEYKEKLSPQINEVRQTALKEFSEKKPMPEPGIKTPFGGDTLSVWKFELDSYIGKKLEAIGLDEKTIYNKWSTINTIKSQERDRKRLKYLADSVVDIKGHDKINKLLDLEKKLSGVEPTKETKEWFTWEQNRINQVTSDIKTRFAYLIGTDTSNSTKKLAQDIIKESYKKFETDHPKPDDSDRDKKTAWKQAQTANAKMKLLMAGLQPDIDMNDEWISKDKHYSEYKPKVAFPKLSEIVENSGKDSEKFQHVDPTRYDDPILSNMRKQMKIISKDDNVKKAFYEYTREGINGYRSINSKAAKGELTDAAIVLKDAIDKTRLEDDIITYRGLDKNTFDLMKKQGGTEVGKIVTMKTFTSTSADPDVVQKWFFEPNRKKDYKQTVIEFQMKKGTPAAYLSDIEGDEAEWIDWTSKETKEHRVMPPQGNAQLREVLVNHGTKFEVVDIIETPKLRKLIWRSV